MAASYENNAWSVGKDDAKYGEWPNAITGWRKNRYKPKHVAQREAAKLAYFEGFSQGKAEYPRPVRRMTEAEVRRHEAGYERNPSNAGWTKVKAIRIRRNSRGVATHLDIRR